MKTFLLAFTIILMCGCASLEKNDSFHLDRNSNSSLRAACKNPGDEGDLFTFQNQKLYFEPIRKITMIGIPFVPMIPVNFGFRKNEIRLMFVDGLPNPKLWRIRISEFSKWIEGNLGDSHLGKFISFEIPESAESLDLQYTGNKSEMSLAHFSRHQGWIYVPLNGFQGEKLSGWIPGCADDK